MNDERARQQAIEDTECDICLSAGAGSGKTTVLIERLIHLLTGGHAELHQIVAITFTEKAAAELKTRLSQALRDRLGGPGEPAAWQVDLGQATIGTIHGFCSTLLRENAVEAAVDPAFGVMDEAGRDSLHREVFDAWLDEMLAAAKDGGGLLAPLLVHVDLRYVREMLLELMGSPLRTEALVGRYGLQDLPEGTPDHARVCRALAIAAQDLVTRSRDCQAQRGSIDFDGLLSRARDLLRDHAGVRAHYRRQFRYAHLDEFQDVDGVQAQLVRLLCGFEGQDDRGDPPRLFVVGDPQQSIYRFRGADVDQFAQMERAILGRDGLSLRLTRCFRSQAGLVGFFNHAFSQMLVPPEGVSTDSRVTYAPIEPVREEDAAAPAVEFLFTPTGARAAEARTEEAVTLARRLRQMLDSGEPGVYERKGNDEIRRGAKAGDVAILLRAMTDVGIYERALRDQGIATYTVAGSGFFGRQEVHDVLNVLRLLTQPRDPLSLSAVLRSPWVGCSDAVLLWFALEETWDDPASPALREKLSAEDAERLDGFLAWFDPLRRHRDRLSIAGLIGELLDRTRYRAVLAAQPEGRQALANLRKLIDLARQFDAGTDPTLHAFVRHLEMRQIHTPREAESALEMETGDTVKLMSIHQAKGLQWPVVAVADLGRGFLMSGGHLLADPAVGMGIQLRGEKLTMEAGPEYGRVKASLDLLELAEQQRVFYVATTRACDRLLLSGSYDPEKFEPQAGGAGSWLQWLGAAYPIDGSPVTYTVGDREIAVRVAPPPEAPTVAPERGMDHPELVAAVGDRSVEGPVDGTDWRDGFLPPPADASGVRVAVTDLEMFNLCPRRYQLRRLLLLPEEAGASELAEEDFDVPEVTPAALLGALVHEVLNGLDPDVTPEQLPTLVKEAAEGRGSEDVEVTEGVEDEAVRLLEAWLATDRWEAVHSSRARDSEVPFHLRLSDGTSLTGRFDLIYRDDGDRWNVLDYKTSRVDGSPDAHVETYYELQQQTYGLAAARLLRDRFGHVAFTFLRNGSEVVWKPDETSLALAEDRIRETISACSDALQSGKFDKTEDAARCVRCGYRSVCGR